MGTQWVAGQALVHCSEEEGGQRGHSRKVPGPNEPGEEAVGRTGGNRWRAMQGKKELRFQRQRGKGRHRGQGSVGGPSRKPCQEVKPATAMSRMVHRGQAVLTRPGGLLPGAPRHPCAAGRRGSVWRRAGCLTALLLWPVGAVEQGLVGVPEELVPGHRVYEAEAGVAVDEGQPTAQFPQRAQPQPADAQPLKGQRVGTTVGRVFGSRQGLPSPSSCPQHTRKTPTETLLRESLGKRSAHHAQSFSTGSLPRCSLMQNSSPDYSQVLEDTEVRQAVWPR